MMLLAIEVALSLEANEARLKAHVVRREADVVEALRTIKEQRQVLLKVLTANRNALSSNQRPKLLKRNLTIFLELMMLSRQSLLFSAIPTSREYGSLSWSF